MTPSSDSSAANPAIAVIAVACRFPDAPHPAAFWRNLLDGKESIRHFSPEELPALDSVDARAAEKNWVPAGAVLTGADRFDAGFFGFIPRHAELLDPQQRLLLECAWETLESAGYPPDGYPGSVGVYVSVARSSYPQGPLRAPVERLVAYAGEDKDFAATRISYKLNLTGPSVVVQSASSSSLVAIHLACESLLAGECDMALAGGACISFPQAGYVYDEALMLSPDGHCRAFDADGAGTVTGNGVGLVALKCLNDALADGDPILAVIRGSAIGNDGAQKVDFFAPSVDGQARVIQEAHAMAGIDPATISYIEAHGTGTALGDPIEIEALRQAFADREAAPGRCAIGSVKTNIGHLHTAAGVAGLIKTVLMLRHGRLVPSLHYHRPNPRIPFAETPFHVNVEARVWDSPVQQPRRAGVSAFGFGGTNAHVVLEEAPVATPSDPVQPWQLLALSARDDVALRQAGERLADHLESHPELNLADVAYTLQLGRKAFLRRRWVLCRDLPEAVAALRQSAAAPTVAEASDVPGAAAALCAAIAAWTPARGATELEQNWRRLGELWQAGQTIPWAAAHAGQRRQRLALPTYPFQRRRYWAVDTKAPEPTRSEGRGDGFASLNAWSRWRWRQALMEQGAWAPGDSTDAVVLSERWRVLPRYRRLLDAVCNWLDEPDDQTLAAWGKQARSSASLAPWLPLIEHCADQFLAVISGEQAATEVLFPGGSAQAVAAIYHSPPLQALNRQIADRIAEEVTYRWRQGAKIVRILEVGAGTGATSAVVWPALAKAQAAQEADVELQYVFSDLSPSLVQQARRQYQADYPWVCFEVLNIEQPAEDAFPADLILAAHVLHATRDIRQTLLQIRQRLTPDGLLLLAETVERQDYLTMTFGLLDGWWLFQDAGLRLAGSPLLGESAWQAELAAQGFAGIAVNSAPGDGPQLALLTARISDSTTPALTRHPSVSREGNIPSTVREVLAGVLGIASTEVVDDRPFAALGVDSIVAPLFAGELNTRLLAELRPTDLYAYSTVAKLAGYLASRLPSSPQPVSLPSEATSTERKHPAIAIIGMAGRWPGADNLSQFWDHLAAGRCAVTPIPPGHWGEAATEGCFGGMLHDHDCFDSWFFQVSPLEAERMDPQQRLFLETAWATLEDAGYSPRQLHERSVGVFVGAQNNDYGRQDAGSLSTIGNSLAILAARIAYHLDLKGPSLSVDTACSSALTAIHLACQSLWQEDSELALAGGVSCMLFSPRAHQFFADSGMASPTGRCHTFAAAADGFVAGDGVGAVLLKPLAAAQRDHDHIYGVILGSATNQDGRSNGITAPSASAQTAVEQRVYERFAIDPATLSYIEAHGTGTALGDPIEVQALTEAFRPYTDHRQFCALGSVKTSIGHTLTAAGVASVQKVLLALRHGQLPPSPYFDRPNPLIAFNETPFYVNPTPVPWPARPGQPRRAAVSGFGFSGTNVHLVIEEAPPAPISPRTRAGQIIALSAQTETALRQRLQDVRDWLDQPENAGIELADIAYTLNAGRAHFSERRVLLAHDRDELSLLLDQALRASTRLLGEGNPANQALAERYLAGEEIAWEDEYRAESPWRVSLPTYPFARERHWLYSHRPAGEGLGAPSSPLPPRERLEVRTLPEHQFTQTWTGQEWFWRDHQVQERPLLPAAWSLHWVETVAATLQSSLSLRSVQWLKPLYGDQSPLTATLDLRQDHDGWAWRIYRDSTAGEEVYCQGRLETGALPVNERLDVEAIRQRCPVVTIGEALYERLRRMGFCYGPGFQSIEQLWSNGAEVLARLQQPVGIPQDKGPCALSPALLDGALQSLIGLLPLDNDLLPLPFALDALEWRESLPSPCYVHARPAAGEYCYHLQLCGEDGRVVAALRDYQVRMLPVVSAKTNNASLATRHYRPEWREASLAHPAAPWPDDGGILLFLPESGPVVTQLARRMQQQWHRFSSPVIVARAGSAYRDHGQYGYQLNLAAPDDHRQLLQNLAQRGIAPARILWLWPLTGNPPGEPTMEAATTALSMFLAGTQALLNTRREQPVALWAVAANDEPLAALLNGAARSLAWETPRLHPRVIRLQPPAVDDPVAWIMAQLCREVVAGEPEIQFSAAGRQSKLLTAIELPLSTSPWLRNGVYLISGGLGGIGLALAERLARQGPVRLMLTGRSAPNAMQQQRIEALRDSGATVEARQVDVTRAAQVETVVSETVQRFGRLDGVIHGAAVVHDQFLINKDLTVLLDVLAPKLLGALNLDRATRDLPLRSFILLSSLAGVLGNAAQSDYAAANGWLDAFAAWREQLRAQGERQGQTLALDLPPWREGGLQLPAEREAELRRELGLVPLENSTALTALEQALASPGSQCVILHGETAALERLARLDSHLIAQPSSEHSLSSSREGNTDAMDRVYPILRDLFARELKLPLERLKPDTDFARYGIDSVLVLQLNRVLAERFGPLPKTLLFEYHSLGGLAAYLETASHEWRAGSSEKVITDSVPHTSQPIFRTDPNAIAIIGISGRYPQADDLDAFWANLREGRDCISEIPPERWELASFFDPQPGQPGKSYSKWGGFLSDVDRFDPLFFHIAPRDAGFMDPQERLFLETAWSAVEDAGYTPTQLGNGQVGVFAGVMYGEYQLFAAEARCDGRFVPVYAPYWSIPNRLSYVMNWHGPSLAVDSACSSSLTAIHLACESLRRGECQTALAGGVNLNLHPGKYLGLSHGRFASSDGRCRSFGAGGDGYVPGEGVGALVLKLLAQAEADGDFIHGVIRATAINHGGKTHRYTVPNPAAQGEVIATALHQAGLEPASISYLEAHGTGTELGDPVEIAGLARAFGGQTGMQQCALGSVKSNIGHLEAAAGVAGVTKVLLQMRHGQLTPSLHADPPNPNLDFAGTPFVLQRSLTKWRRPQQPDGNEYPRRAGVSAFGAGGANAHVIIEEYHAPSTRKPASGPLAFVLSARDGERLREQAERLHAAVAAMPAPSLADMAYTLQIGREPLPWRLAVVADDQRRLLNGLEAFLTGRTLSGVYTDRAGEPESMASNFSVDADSLAQRWVAGGTVNWSGYWRNGRRIPLPGYPFARIQYGLPEGMPIANHPDPADHPSLSREGNIVVWSQSWRGNESWLRDHRLHDEALLPAAGYLALVVERFAKATPFELRDIVWQRPFKVVDAPVSLALCQHSESGQPGFAFIDPAKPDAPPYCRGLLMVAVPKTPPMIPLTGWRQRCAHELTGEQVYARFKQRGLQYGSTFRRIERLWIGADEALAYLTAPLVTEDANHLLPAELLDAAWQALIGLHWDSGEVGAPFSAERVTIHAPISEVSYAVVRRESAQRFAVTLTDPEGRVLAEVVGLSVRPLAAVEPALSFLRPGWRREPWPAAPSPGEGAVLLLYPPQAAPLAATVRQASQPRPVWEAVWGETDRSLSSHCWQINPQRRNGFAALLATIGPISEIIFLGGALPPLASGGDGARLAAAETAGVMALLHFSQAWLEQNASQTALLKVVTQGAQVVAGDTAIQPWSAAVIGLAKVMGRELPRLTVLCIDLPVELDPTHTQWAVRLLAERENGEFAWRGDWRYRRELVPVELPLSDHPPLRQKGVYLIAGGAGGLGMALARWLAQHYQARVALLGRGSVEDKQSLLVEIAALGGEAMYCQADLASPEAMQAAVSQVKARWGTLHGAVHSALVLADRGLLRMDETSFRAALDPKAQGSVALAQALTGESLDFLAFFSSANALYGNPGQANYVAGCVFKDAFAHYLAQQGWPVRIINWGYWGEIGSVANPETRQRLAQQGIASISEAEGMAAFVRALAASLTQVAAIKASPVALATMAVTPNRRLHPAPVQAHMLPATLTQAEKRAEAPAAARAVFADFQTLEAYARRYAGRVLWEMGLQAGVALTIAEWQTRLGISDRYQRLLAALLALLARENCLQVDRQGRFMVVADEPPDRATLAVEARRLQARSPLLEPYFNLLHAAFAGYPSVLRGQQEPTAVLFPQGSLRLVEGIYAGNAATDFYNHLLADSVRAGVAAVLNRQPSAQVRVLEVGGGTGGTTRFVLEALAEFAAQVDYVFTDLSPGFLRNAEQRFGANSPFLRTQVLDIERDPAKQGFAPGSFDVVIAANVLHATRDLPETLRHCKRLLKTHGLLLLNEISRPQDFATLTFGLTSGWWRYADEDNRLPHGPAAHPRQWLGLLHEAGFPKAAAFPEPEHSEAAAFQCVLIAESDGWLESGNTLEQPAMAVTVHTPHPTPHPQGESGLSRVSNSPRSPGKGPEVRTAVEHWLAGIIAAVLKLAPNTLEPQEPFERYGLESLAVLEIIARLETDLGKLPKTLLFEYVTLRQLAMHLLEQYGEPLQAVLTPSPQSPLPPGEGGLGREGAGDNELDKESGNSTLQEARRSLINEPIAIIGLSGRYPGADDLEQFWDNLRAGRSAITSIPPERWDAARYCDPERRDASKSYTPYGAFLRDIDCFDAALFHLSPREARAMDPQERLFLETAWATLEDAGYTPSRLAQRSQTVDSGDVGIFVGVMYGPYQWLALEAWQRGQISDAHSAYWSIANRASYLFDFHGPSLAVDTACSSSLTAIHLACESIRRGECRAALAGGVNLILHPLHHIALSRMQMLSPGPECRAFGAGADGFVSGEGVGAVLLRPLSDALRDGDRIHAVIRGSAVNAGGRTNGYTVPNPQAQAKVIVAALQRAGVDPRTISYLEAHGTGTPLGDPVEIQGLRQAFGRFTGGRGFCALGSVKSNIGHLESAAGVAALTKVVLQLRHRWLAPTLYADSPNPLIPLAESPFRLQTGGGEWLPDPGAPRRAGISSFGAGGANVHLIVEEAPPLPMVEARSTDPQLIVLSAQQPEQLAAQAARLRDHLRGLDTLPPLAAIAYTLQVGRQALPERWATVVGDTPQLLAALDALLNDSPAPTPVWRQRIRRDAPAHCAVAPLDRATLAQHWQAGGEVDWDSFHLDPKPRIVTLPHYPFARKRYWLTDPGFATDISLTAPETAPLPEREELQVRAEPVADYYDATARHDHDDPAEQFLSLAPLPQPLPDFSWTLAFFTPERHPQQRQLLRRQQEELRQVLLRNVDFSRVATVFDFGCGVGADLLRLAQHHPHLHGAGYTLSARQCHLANEYFAAAGCSNRLRVYHRDSAIEPFPGAFDLILGIEVAHHIADKAALFAHLAGALNPAGQLALADCVAPTTAAPLADTGSFTLNHARYSELLSQHGLRISDCVDASPEIANGLHDADFEKTLAVLRADPNNAEQLDRLIHTHRSWDNFGKALNLKLIRYLLLTIVKDAAAPAVLLEANRAMLEHATPYAQVTSSLAAPKSADATETVTALLQQHLAAVLQFEIDEVDPDARFAELGMDSLTGLRFLDGVNQALGLSLGAEVTYNHSSINDLAGFIVREQGGALIRTNNDKCPSLPEESNHPSSLSRPGKIQDSPRPLAGEGPGVRAEPIAVIGLAARFAGADNARQFWRNLAAGVDAVGEVPPHRWRLDQYYDSDPQRLDTSYGKWGAFLNDYDCFDPLFFNLSPREAEYMDPQQRLFLEECWKALEDAGYAESSLAGLRCGVYAGVLGGNEYAELLQRNGRPPDAYQMLGNSASILAARIAYTLNLKGPSLSLDTACSSGLVAVDLACKALQSGDIDMALAGGVSLYLSERPFILMSRAGMLSPTGRCRTFDQAADGIVPGEGVGVVVLKRLDRALADRDHIYGVIAASGTNQDGRTNGITAPSGDAQTALILDLYRQAGIDPATVGYIEAHGTGTSLGDPIEVSALSRAFGQHHIPPQSCALGSVKSNIGHTAAAAGIAGLVKVLFSLQHGQLPPSLHFHQPNPRIRLEATPFYVNDRLSDWPEPRRAALSAFGFSGANAHAVIDPAPPLPPVIQQNGPWLFTVSAKTVVALDQRLIELADYLEADGAALNPGDVSFTLNVGRAHFLWREAFVAATLPELIGLLRQAAGQARQPLNRLKSNSVSGTASSPPRRLEADANTLAAWADRYRQGAELDWSQLYAGETVGRVSLPTYPFARERYWCDAQPVTTPVPATATTPPAEAHPVWLFQRIWQDAALTATTPLPDFLLLFSEDAVLVAACRQQVSTVIQVIPGMEYGWRDAHCLALSPARLADYRQMLTDLRQRGFTPGAIVHGWTLSPASSHPPMLNAALTIGLESVMALVSALMQTQTSTPLLFFHENTATLANAVHGAVAGLAQSLTEGQVILRDIALSTADLTPDRLLTLARIEFSPSASGVARYQNGQRQIETVATLNPPPTEEILPLNPGATVLITGGLGGVGFALARNLAMQQPVRLALLGRSPLDEGKQQRLRELIALGADAHYFVADVSQADALRAALASMHTHFGELHGVIHAAGALDPRPLADRGEDDWRAVLAPKLQGTALLDELTRDQPLRWFLLCSSLAATVGDFGFGDYAAANRFVSTFAALRESGRRDGQRQGVTVAVEWPLWEGGGMRFLDQGQSLFQQVSGMVPLNADQGGRVFRQAVSIGEPVVLAAAGERDRLLNYLSGVASKSSKVRIQGSPASSEASLVQLSATEPLAGLRQDLRGWLAEVTRLPVERLEDQVSFTEYGFDSILLKESAITIGRRLGIDLSPTVFYAHGTMAELSQYLLDEHPALAQRYSQPQQTTPQDSPHPLGEGPGVRAEPIAVIGMSGRFPQSRNLAEYWQHLAAGDDLIGPPPAERLASGASLAGFIPDPERFDAAFFQISPREAELMDPQQRLFLEECWRTLEDAGYRPSALAGHRCGVFVGVQSNDYLELLREVAEPQIVSGTTHALLANRVSYLFDWQGPSEALDTACSSSLVAVHRAMQALRAGECELALAGGVNLLLAERSSALVESMGVLSPTRRCRTFGRDADGYVRGEGVGVVALKRLSQAQADGDAIHGVLLASAVNHGGRATSLTAPNPRAQTALLTQVWNAAGVSPATISYLEAHGTGTELGDPIEVEGIQAAFAEQAQCEQITLPAQSCGLGSVKSNIGHLEPASGIAGLIKVLLALRHRTLPATLHCQDVNPYIKLAGSPLYLVTRAQPWPAESGHPRRAGVSSFGFGGVNAHILVEETPAMVPQTAQAQSRLFPLSARDDAALYARAEQLRDWLAEQQTPVDAALLADLAFTLQAGREAFEQRLVVTAATVEELLAGLNSFLAGEPAANLYQGRRVEPLSWRELLTPMPTATLPNETAAMLAKRWVAGELVAWATLDPSPRRRLHLPDYPFAGPRYWPISASPLPPVGEGLGERVFRSTITPSDWRVRDHRVGHEAVLPAMACVAMAWSAAREQIPDAQVHGLRDLTWLRPLKMDGAARELTLSLQRNGQDNVMRFELQSQLNDESPQLHAQGEISLNEPPPRLPALALTAIRQRCTCQQSGEVLYQKLAEQDLHYGPSFRLLETVWSNDDEALGRLRPPLPGTDEDELNPAILDAAVQTAAALTGNTAGAGSPLPFTLAEAQIGALLHNARYAYVRRRGHNGALPPLDISLCDDQGQVLVELRDFHARLAPPPPQVRRESVIKPHPISFFVPGWRVVATEPYSAGRVLLFRQPGDGLLGEALAHALGVEAMQVWLAGGWQRLGRRTWRIDAANPEHYQQLLEAAQPDSIYFPGGWYEPDALNGQEALATANETLLILLRLLQTVTQRSNPPVLRVITHDLYPLAEGDPVAPWSGTLIGLCRSFALEDPDADIHCLDLCSRDLPAQLATDSMIGLREPAEATDLQWVWRDGQCRAQTLDALDLPPAELPFCKEGGYLLTGGAGGLGAAFARRLASDYQARLLLTGRRPPNDPAISALLLELNTLGGECAYRQVDAGDRDGMAALLGDLRQRWGRLNGVLHCPLELCNVSLAKMSEAELLAPLAAKVEAATVLYDLLRDEPLDFVALFSSAIALTGGAGQSNYAAASTGMDAIARAWRTQARYPVKTLNWGYWGETGIVATPEHRTLVARQGVAPIGTAEGIAAFAAMLAAPQSEMMAIKLLPERAPRPEWADQTTPPPTLPHNGGGSSAKKETSKA